MDLIQKSRQLPTQPGVYLFKNGEGTVIYVGKAKDLRARVRTYFLAGAWENAKTGSLVREAVELETIVVDTEAEALALENTLIKQHQPRFNILLRDDKTYPYIRLSHEAFPRVYVTRRVIQDGSEYFGPYFPAGLAYRLLHFIHKYFQVPSCRVDLSRPHPRPCLQYHLHRCLGPCVPGLVDPERYRQAVQDTRLFLSGRHADLTRELKQRRDAAAAAERFEEAASYRDLLTVLDEVQERQKMHAVSGADADIVGFYREGERMALNLFHLRHGRVVDRREFFRESLPETGLTLDDASEVMPQDGAAPVEDSGAPDGGSLEMPRAERASPAANRSPPPSDQRQRPSEKWRATEPVLPRWAPRPSTDAAILGALLKQIYLQQPYLPPQVSVPLDFEDREALATALTAQRGSTVDIAVPQRGAKKSMLDLAAKNARNSFARRFRSLPAAEQANADWAELGRALGLDLGATAGRIECFDISHFQGAETVASMVVWQGGRMDHSLYRKYRIRTVAGVDDFRSMAEVVGRRYRRLQAEDAVLPHLILIDGGVGQLHAAQAVLAELGLEQLPLASLAKREELIYVAGQEHAPVRLGAAARPLQILQTVRDEAHRFAITFHRLRRGQALTAAGAGPKPARRRTSG